MVVFAYTLILPARQSSAQRVRVGQTEFHGRHAFDDLMLSMYVWGRCYLCHLAKVTSATGMDGFAYAWNLSYKFILVPSGCDSPLAVFSTTRNDGEIAVCRSISCITAMSASVRVRLPLEAQQIPASILWMSTFSVPCNGITACPDPDFGMHYICLTLQLHLVWPFPSFFRRDDSGYRFQRLG